MPDKKIGNTNTTPREVINSVDKPIMTKSDSKPTPNKVNLITSPSKEPVGRFFFLLSP